MLVVEEGGEACILSQFIEIIINLGCSQEIITRPFTWLNLRDARKIIFGLLCFFILLFLRASALWAPQKSLHYFLKKSEIFRKRWRDIWGAHRAEARRISKVRRIRGPNIIFLAPQRFGHVNGLVMISWEQPRFMTIFMNWLRMRASPTSSTTGSISISYLPILSCKTFIIILRSHRLQYHFIYMMNSGKCLYVIFARYVGYPMREN